MAGLFAVIGDRSLSQLWQKGILTGGRKAARDDFSLSCGRERILLIGQKAEEGTILLLDEAG